MDREARKQQAHPAARAVVAAIEALEEAPCSLRELARESGLSVAALSRYRSGDRPMRLYHARQVLDALETVRDRYSADAERCAELADAIRTADEEYRDSKGEE